MILGSPAKAGDRLHGAKELDERSEVVRAHIQQRSSTFLEKKLWIWMPGIRAWIAKRGLGRDRGAYPASLDHSACRLQTRTEEGVGSIAQLDFVLSSRRDNRLALFERQRERLLAIDMLACTNRLERHAGVDRRNGQIHDQFNVGHLQNRGQIRGVRHPVFGRLRRRPTQVDIGARNDVDIWEADQVSQVLVADVTATDDGNSDWFKSIAHKMFLALDWRVIDWR